jgi:hypothetical protein
LAFYIVDRSRGFIDRLPFRKELLEIKTNVSDIYEIFKDAVSVLKQEKALSLIKNILEDKLGCIVLKDDTSYYTQAQTNANFLSGKTVETIGFQFNDLSGTTTGGQIYYLDVYAPYGYTINSLSCMNHGC